MRNVALGIALLALLPAGALAATRSSFFDVTNMTDVTVTPSNGGLTYTVAMGANPTLDYDGVTYQITDLFGFFALSDDNDLAATGANQNGWTWELNNSGTGGIAGWDTNPNSGITPGQSLVFNFTTLDVPSVESFGFHMRFSTNFAETGGNTAFVNAVPEPATLGALALGALGLLRRRRKA